MTYALQVHSHPLILFPRMNIFPDFVNLLQTTTTTTTDGSGAAAAGSGTATAPAPATSTMTTMTPSTMLPAALAGLLPGIGLGILKGLVMAKMITQPAKSEGY